MDKKAIILDIAMNLNRIGNWIADDFKNKEKRINFFLEETRRMIDSLNPLEFSEKFQKTYRQFLKDYSNLENGLKTNPKDPLYFAEMMMTWGNILTHRAKLIN